MSYALSLRCRKCGGEYPLQAQNLCDFCFGPLDVAYDYKAMAASLTRDKIARGPVSMWRYADLLPIAGEPVDLGTGFTPLTRADNLGRLLGLEQLYIKNDCLNPTWSFKDRAVAVAVTKARELGFTTIACASTGNLAASVAAHAVKAGLKSYVFFPSDIEQGKIVSTAIHNPTLVAVQGSYDKVNHLCHRLVEAYGWGFININLRPYYAEGSKTLGYEIAEQLGWRSPDRILAPSASGLLFTRIWKGLNELSMLGLIGPVNTHMHCVQAAGSSPIVNAFENGTLHVLPVEPQTIAKSIAVGNPADGNYALKAARESGGTAASVSDDEIIEGIRLLAETEGIFSEPAGGVVIGALRKMAKSGIIRSQDVTVACITGSGLKTQEIVSDSVRPVTIEPSLQSFESMVCVPNVTAASD